MVSAWASRRVITGSPVRASILGTVASVTRFRTGIVTPASLPTPAVKMRTPLVAAAAAAASASPLRLSPSPTSKMTFVRASLPVRRPNERSIAAAMSVPGGNSRSPGSMASMISAAVTRSRVSGKRTSASPAKMTTPTRSPDMRSSRPRSSAWAACMRLGSASSAAMLSETSSATTMATPCCSSSRVRSPICGRAMAIASRRTTPAIRPSLARLRPGAESIKTRPPPCPSNLAACCARQRRSQSDRAPAATAASRKTSRAPSPNWASGWRLMAPAATRSRVRSAPAGSRRWPGSRTRGPVRGKP